MKSIELSIILVSYNTADYTIRALESVYAQTHGDFEVIVVDNASSDDSVKKIKDNFPQIKLIESKTNLGFAGGVQLGTKASIGKYFLLLNPDTIVLDQAIDRLLQFAKQYANNGIWGGVTLNNDLSINTQHAWSQPSFRNLLFSALGLEKLLNKSCFFNHSNYGCWTRNTIKEVDIISGCFFLITRELWDKLGGLDTTFFMYAEEADFCLKAKKLGYQPIVNPEARIIHHGGVSHSRFSGKLIKLLKGKVELINRHIPAWKKPIYKSLLYLYVFNKYFMHKLLKRNTEQSMEWQIVFDQRQQWLKGYS